MAGFIQMFTNYLNAVVGRNQEFEELIAHKDIGRVREMFVSKAEQAREAITEYDTETHAIMFRKDKILKDKDGNRKGFVKRWKLPIGYPAYINEIALVFIFGRPIKWTQESEKTDEAFSAYTDFIKRTHFNSKVRQCKRLAGKETQSAMLFRVFKDRDGKPDCQIRVLARSKGDEIYARWDLYENLVSFAWGYYVKETSTTSAYHFDIFTPDWIYRCKQVLTGWEVVAEKNPIGKIPVILFEQEKEWEGATRLIEREEYVGSRSADTNDYFSDPKLVIDADVIKSMPKKDDENKTLVAKPGTKVSEVAHYLTWDSAPESKKQEIEWLEKHILTKTFTPNIDFDNMKGLSNVSGKALEQMMMLATIKADKRKDTLDELMERTSSLIKAIIGNVLDTSLYQQCQELEIGHEFQEPFGEDITEVINNIVKAKDGEIMSTDSAIALNPLVKDHLREQELVRKEAEDAAQRQRDIFGAAQSKDDVFGGAE